MNLEDDPFFLWDENPQEEEEEPDSGKWGHDEKEDPSGDGGGGGEAAHGLSGAGNPCERGCPGPLYLFIIQRSRSAGPDRSCRCAKNEVI